MSDGTHSKCIRVCLRERERGGEERREADKNQGKRALAKGLMDPHDRPGLLPKFIIGMKQPMTLTHVLATKEIPRDALKSRRVLQNLPTVLLPTAHCPLPTAHYPTSQPSMGVCMSLSTFISLTFVHHLPTLLLN